MEKNKSNPDTQGKENEKDLLGKVVDRPEDVDSSINTDHANGPDGKSLTNDEDASTDPDKVPNKPGFKDNN